MRRTLLAVLSLAVAAGWAADNIVAGKWDCTSSSGSGQELTWLLAVTEEKGGKLSGSLTGADGAEIPLVEPKLDGNIFTFRINVNPDCVVQARLKIEGRKMEGGFGCAEASGTFKGTKRLGMGI